MDDGLGVVVVERSEAVVEAVDVELGVVGEKVEPLLLWKVLLRKHLTVTL